MIPCTAAAITPHCRLHALLYLCITPAATCCCRHLDDVRRQQEGAGEVKRSLDAQVAAVRDRQAAEAHLEAQEVQRMQQHWAQLQVSTVQL